VKTNGTLACWGSNNYGQATPPAGTFTQVDGGMEHTCAVKTAGTIACWGRNSKGQATPPAGTFTQVSAGGFHTCAVKTGGTIACWGDNTRGQLTPPAQPVGGIAECPDPATASAQEARAPAGGSGWSAGKAAALSGVIAAAVLAALGAWYARRRWLRPRA